MTKIT